MAKGSLALVETILIVTFSSSLYEIFMLSCERASVKLGLKLSEKERLFNQPASISHPSLFLLCCNSVLSTICFQLSVTSPAAKRFLDNMNASQM